MLVGEDEDLLTVVYGPAPPATWTTLHREPRRLLNNGLWEAIYDASDALLIDSSTDGVKRHGYLLPHWHHEPATPQEANMTLVTPRPRRIGENDVDTVLHLLLARHAGSSVFEGMCNPPGGDWSGVSLQTSDRRTELRWLTLPRVSGQNAKRPDHVFQIFGAAQQPIVLCVESKEKAASVEKSIGPRLTTYIIDLVRTPASIERSAGASQWEQSARQLDPHDFITASAVAFLTDSDERINAVRARASADLLMIFSIRGNGSSCTIHLVSTTAIGRSLAGLIASIPLAGANIRIVVS